MDKIRKIFKKVWICTPIEIKIGSFSIILDLIACKIQSGNPLSVLFSVISISGLFFSFALISNFLICIFVFNKKIIKHETKFSFMSFTFFFIIFIIILIIIFHNKNFANIPKIIKNVKEYEQYSSFIMDDKLNLAIFLDFMFAFVFWFFYFIFCVIKIFQLTRTLPILFMFYEKFLRSRIVAIVAWLLIATNIGPMTIDSSGFFKFFYIIFGSLAALAYPFFDMFEFTYQQIDEYENGQDNKKKLEKTI